MALASASASRVSPLHLKFQSCSLTPPTIRCFNVVGSRQFCQIPSASGKQKMDNLKLSSSHSICSSGLQPPLLLRDSYCGVLSPSISGSSARSRFTVFAAKGYKMKTHKASAKRFRVSGTGKIMRRKSGKEHLLLRKSRTRKLRLSKMAQVSKRDYDNVVSCLPYMKVNRNA